MGAQSPMRMAGIILAGGQSRRFGEPKALVKWKGIPFLSYAVEALRPVTDNIVVISHLAELHEFPDIRVTEDIPTYQGNGPLAGILTGMETLEADWYIVLPCDTPLITNEIVERLVQYAKGEAVIPMVAGREQPLVAVYHRSVQEKLRQQLQEGKRSMHEFLALCSVTYVTEHDLAIHPSVFCNINTKQEYSQLL